MNTIKLLFLKENGHFPNGDIIFLKMPGRLDSGTDVMIF
jgi:hypothetical protein